MQKWGFKIMMEDNRMKKKFLSIVLTLGIVITLISTYTVMAQTNIKIGDYVQMGKYYDEQILWRCVNIDENGPLMLSDKILTIKPFDARGAHKYLDGTDQTDNSLNYRTIFGSNLWETSNIRSWLNSTATAGTVIWLDGCPPTEDKIDSGNNAYANEKGFLAEGNFTVMEQANIKSVSQKSLLNDLDVAKLNTGGTALHKYGDTLATIMQNYDNAYYYNVTDKIFLLDVKQLYNAYQNSDTLGEDYYRGKPTQNAVDNSQYKNVALSVSDYWSSWLRSSNSFKYFPNNVRHVYSFGDVLDNNAQGSNFGARPAFYLNLSSVIFEYGNSDGSEGNPFIVQAVEPIRVLLNGKEIIFDQYPILENNRTLVPIRSIFEAMDAKVDWDEDTQTVTVTKADVSIIMQAGNTLAYKNGKEIVLDVPAKIVNDRTLVPDRFIAESLGAKVSWDAKENRVVIIY